MPCALPLLGPVQRNVGTMKKWTRAGGATFSRSRTTIEGCIKGRAKWRDVEGDYECLSKDRAGKRHRESKRTGWKNCTERKLAREREREGSGEADGRLNREKRERRTGRTDGAAGKKVWPKESRQRERKKGARPRGNM